MEEREESDAKFSRNQDKLGLAALREEKGTSRDETIGGGKIWVLLSNVGPKIFMDVIDGSPLTREFCIGFLSFFHI